jgi:HAD superfamily hydrolase (TIGR01490 family)
VKQSIAFFDFDDTLIHGDSIRYLLQYCIKKHPLSIGNFIFVGWHYMAHKWGKQPINKAKSALLFPLKRMSDKELEVFFKKEIESRYYPKIVTELKAKKEQGYYIYIVSASVEAYLRFCTLPVDCILGTKVKICGGQYTNEMIGKNCKNEEKVNRIQIDLQRQGIEIDYDTSYAYSDSPHDIPMLKLVKHRIQIIDGEMTPFIIRE